MSGRILHILIAEPDVKDFITLGNHLSKAFKNTQLVYCQQLEKAAEISFSVDFDVLITSADLSQPVEKEYFNKIIRQEAAPAVILLTDYPNERFSLEWMAAGAQDCIPKENLNSHILYQSIAYAVARRIKNLSVLAKANQYKKLFAQNPLPVLVYEVDSKKIVLANAAAESFYGYPATGFELLKLNDLQPENGPAGIFAGQKKHRLNSGKLVWVEVFTNLVRISQKTCRQMVIVEQPGPENHATMQQLLLLQSAIGKSADGVIITKSISGDFCSSEIVYSNMAFNKLSGFSSAETLGQKPEQLHKKHPVKEASDNNFLTESFETRFINYQNNCETWADYSVSAVADADAKTTHFVAVYRDVSARKKAETENQNLIRNLEQTNQELKQFSYVIAHNLRAPLANLTGLLSLLNMETIADADTLELLEAVKSSTNKLNTTVNDIIDVLMIKSEDSHVAELLQVAQAWEKAKTSLAFLIETAGAQIEQDFSEAPQVLFTAGYLDSILVNFLSNALKYKSDERQLVINLKTYQENGWIVLIFEDNGIGIDMNRYGGQVFGLYKRFSNKAEGKGLGLYIVQAQITAMGGKVEVNSELNKGTRFTVYFKK